MALLGNTIAGSNSNGDNRRLWVRSSSCAAVARERVLLTILLAVVCGRGTASDGVCHQGRRLALFYLLIPSYGAFENLMADGLEQAQLTATNFVLYI